MELSDRLINYFCSIINMILSILVLKYAQNPSNPLDYELNMINNLTIYQNISCCEYIEEKTLKKICYI